MAMAAEEFEIGKAYGGGFGGGCCNGGYTAAEVANG
jgi:hypothetical protein